MLRDAERDEEDASLNRLGDDFDETKSNVTCLWSSEVGVILDREIDRIQMTDPNEIPSSYIQKSLKYVKKFSNFENSESIDQAKKIFYTDELNTTDHKYSDFSQFEIACLNNLNVMSVEEALTLVPSLKDLAKRISKRKNLSENDSSLVDVDGLIQDVLDDLKRHQNS